MATFNKNTYPYFDDYNENKKYYQLMFNPGRAVQARELTQIQSQIQKQIERFGSHVFKEGSMVIPGEFAIDMALPYLKLEFDFNNIPVNITNFENKTIVGLNSGTMAKVIGMEEIDGTDPNTLFVQILTGDSSFPFTASIAASSDIISNISVNAETRIKIGSRIFGNDISEAVYVKEIIDQNTVRVSTSLSATNALTTLSINTASNFEDGEIISTVEEDVQDYRATLVDTDATGLGSKVQINQGVFFALGYFCLVDNQTIILDKYSDTPSYRVGLEAIETIINAKTDDSLNDPASGSTNYNAPGADRYSINLVLSKVDLDQELPDNFIELIRVDNGVVQKMVNKPEYSELEKTFARRTYDESGDYTVRAFSLDVKEHLDDGVHGGVYPIEDGGDINKLALMVGAGKAYVRGYEIESQSTQIIPIEKSRDFLTENNFTTAFTLGNYVIVDNVSGTFNITSLETVDLKDNGGATIGTARVRAFTLVSGTPSHSNTTYALNIFDINMSGSNLFTEVETIEGATATASIVLENGVASLKDSNNSTQMVLLPEYATKTILDDTIFTVRRYLTGSMIADSISFTANPNEIFSSGNILNYHVSIVSASGTAIGNSYADGDVIDMTASGNSITLSGTPTGRQVILTIPEISGSTIELIATVTKTVSSPKTKTRFERTQTIPFNNFIQLDRADIIELKSVVNDGIDYTSRFTLDNGQRDTFYDRGSLTYNTSYSPLVGNVVVTYDYFEHGAGDYFNVDSYSGVIQYELIPVYISPNGTRYDLINTLDFRPRMNNSGSALEGVTEIAAPNSSISLDYEYYVARIDRLVLDTFGNFKVLKGSSGVSPQPPNMVENSMPLYELFLPPYTFTNQEVVVRRMDNRRYTMQDIGKLDKRITNLEYYTSLSLLEKATAEMFIDDGTGNNRFKNGFVVDSFTTNMVADTISRDFKCSISPREGALRPSFKSRNVGLELDTVSSSGYVKTGDLLTLPYTEEVFIEQPFASLTENVNPYNIFNWIGKVDITPSSDDWYEETQIPDFIVNNNVTDPSVLEFYSLLGQTIWGDWVTDWVGEEVSRETVTTRVGEEYKTKYWHTSKGGRWLNGIFQDTVTEDLVVNEVGQVRQGTNYSLMESETNEVIDDRIVNTSNIPFIRSRTIEFSAENLKPLTRVYPFFDNVNVSSFSSPTDGSIGDPLITDGDGKVSGTYTIPNSESLRFRTGTRVFKLIDTVDGKAATATTSADALYIAQGVLATRQNTIQSTRTTYIAANEITDNRIHTQTSSENVVDGRVRIRHLDPIAQSFLVDNNEGVFVSKVDVYFSTKSASNIPVTLSIRDLNTGYPTQNIVPFSEVSLLPSQVNTSEDGSIKTTFTFPSPVYLSPFQEYAFVLISNSDEYNVFCSKVGDFDILSGNRITSQPYTGSMFKSQNASTWTAEQEQDIKFIIHRCKFDTNISANIIFNNKPVLNEALPLDPFETTDTSNTVIVFHPNHGMSTGDETTIVGVVGTQNGIPDTELNDTHEITYIDIDKYSIIVTTDATSNGKTGGVTVRATPFIRLDIGNINIQHLSYPNTTLGFGVATTNIGGIISSIYDSISLGEDIIFDNTKIIESGNADTLSVRGNMSSSSDFISPVIDVQRSSIITVSMRMNNDATDEDAGNNGSALAKYVTKPINLSSSANGVRVYFNALRPNGNEFKVYARIRDDSQQGVSFSSLPYVELDAVAYPSISSSQIREYSFELMNTLPEFSLFSIKIVMLSEDGSQHPIIREFRAIATGT